MIIQAHWYTIWSPTWKNSSTSNLSNLPSVYFFNLFPLVSQIMILIMRSVHFRSNPKNFYFLFHKILFMLFHQILIIQNTLNILEQIFELEQGLEVVEIDCTGLSWQDSVWMWFSISFSGSSLPGGNRKHCSPLKFGVVVPCHGEGSGMTLPSQCTQPLGKSPSVLCSDKPVIKFASGTQGIIVPTGMSDSEVVGSKGSTMLKSNLISLSFVQI